MREDYDRALFVDEHSLRRVLEYSFAPVVSHHSGDWARGRGPRRGGLHQRNLAREGPRTILPDLPVDFPVRISWRFPSGFLAGAALWMAHDVFDWWIAGNPGARAICPK